MTGLPLWARWARVYATGGAIVGVGVLLYKYASPTDEQVIAGFSPEVRANYEKNKELRRREQEELMKIVQKTAASNDPIWMTGPLSSPFEPGKKNKDWFEEIEKKLAQDRQKQELEKAKKEAEEFNNDSIAVQENTKSKGWFR
ncbi:Cbp4p [Ascoidea rubescens DSM 1968]|uniref:Cytochrome b mRNA-processing protein 4 n=1 Tax=Ascoidea rubescens DSM 1968 TaxID=1344418 RepID=A0A1D2VSF6_9ASCO|nr:CBP4-domain-containing protein [Ascoidea rubescens DSM 1968]ODV64507.1 CBP4-domain-containing protein [Ascoidea rubescens DSM 1968]